MFFKLLRNMYFYYNGKGQKFEYYFIFYRKRDSKILFLVEEAPFLRRSLLYSLPKAVCLHHKIKHKLLRQQNKPPHICFKHF